MTFPGQFEYDNLLPEDFYPKEPKEEDEGEDNE